VNNLDLFRVLVVVVLQKTLLKSTKPLKTESKKRTNQTVPKPKKKKPDINHKPKILQLTFAVERS